MIVAFAAVLALLNLQSAASANCLDNAGKKVSWSFTYKFPNGFDIAYYDQRTPNSETIFNKYGRSLDDKSDPVAVIRTLRGLLPRQHEGLVSELASEPSTLNATAAAPSGYLMYNDEPDNAKPGTGYGHTKGVIALSGNEAIWLVHSTPHWPSSDGHKEFYFPETETEYGQTFICIQITASQVDTVAKLLQYNKPYVYKSTFGSDIGSTHPELQKVLDGQWVSAAGTTSASIGEITSFTAFAKNANWGQDLWADLVAEHFKSDLYVETWIRGSAEGSYCRPKHKYEVLDVETMVARSPNGNITWSEGQDHAKWAVMLDGSSKLCVGDINRMTTQRNRGGGAVCFSDKGLSTALYNSIVTGHLCK